MRNAPQMSKKQKVKGQPKGQIKGKRQAESPRATIPAHLRGPLPPPHFGPLNGQLSKTALDAQRIRILGDRLEGLAKHYGVSDKSPNKWFWLSVELAKEIGLFDRASKKNRTVRAEDKQMELVAKVDAINAERRRGIEDAVRILQQREPKYRKMDRDTEPRKTNPPRHTLLRSSRKIRDSIVEFIRAHAEKILPRMISAFGVELSRHLTQSTL
jgi:hypothetical protein